MPDATRIALASVLIVLAGPLTALAFGRSRPRRALALVIALAAQAIPFVLPPEWRFLRALYTLAAFVSILRVIDLWRDPTSYPLPQRLWLLTALFDTRRVRHADPLLDWRRFAKVAGYVSLMAAGLDRAADLLEAGSGIVLGAGGRGRRKRRQRGESEGCGLAAQERPGPGWLR